MSVDSAENNVSSAWGHTSTSTSNYDNGTNQWLVNSSEKVCGSWAQAVSGNGDSSTNSNIPNNQTNKLNSSNQSDHNLIDDNGSQTNQNLVLSSHFNFDDLNSNDLYSTKWGKSVIDHDNAWGQDDLSPSSNSANNANRSSFDSHIANNNGTELWINNLRQTKELQGNNSTAGGLDLQASNLNQQSIEQANNADTQWSKLQATANHFGGHWGEEEDLSNVWCGIPNSSQNSATNQNVNSSTSTSNVFNNRQPNSINCDKGNLQLLTANPNTIKNWISDDNHNNNNNNNWNDSIKTSNDNWDNSADISMLNSNLSTTKPENTEWNYYPTNKLSSAVLPNQTVASWSNEADKTMPNESGDIDNGTSLWGNPQGQNKALIWQKEENKQRNNSQAIINNVEQWKKYSLNGAQQINNGNNKGNWNNELIDGNVPGTSSNLAWNNDPNSADDSDWTKNKRKLTKEMIASSSPFRILVEMGFKEEDVENSLRNTNFNLQESIEELRLNTLKETGVEIDRRKQQAQSSPIQSLPSVNNMLRSNVASTNKLLNQSANLPSEKLLSHFVQQIQLAVQSGHLNAQILNQQLAPSTITLIYQLLQQIKIMQSLQGSNNVSKNYLQNSYQISQCKQKIATLQKQINVQQQLLFKQQIQQQSASNHASGSGRPNPIMNNNLGNLVNDLSNLQLNQQNQSRFNQWKLPTNYDKDDLMNYDALANINQTQQQNDFSRAPGPSSKQQPQQFISPQNSWSNAIGDESGWQQNKNQLSSSAPQQLQMNPNYNEMVSDFTSAANKQWKPETMMSNNPQIDQMYNWSASNKLVDSNDNLANASNAFNSSTWTFSNSNAQLAASTPQQNAIWANNQQTASVAASKPKGPPPGLAQVQQQKDLNSNFLLIRNLPIQIDESILKALCRQHGSLLFFHLFLNHGLAIVKYSSKDEAMKAQQALNNCPLNNTTIQVQIASESEVQQYLANCQIATNTNTSTASSIYTGANNQVGGDYMLANNGAWNNNGASQQLSNASTMWSFNQQPNNLWNIDQNSNSALHNLLPDNLLEST